LNFEFIYSNITAGSTYHVSLLADTIFQSFVSYQDSMIYLDKWFLLTWMVLNHGFLNDKIEDITSTFSQSLTPTVYVGHRLQ